MARIRITVRGENLELRGYTEHADQAIALITANQLASVVDGMGVVIASPSTDSSVPWGYTEEEMRAAWSWNVTSLEEFLSNLRERREREQR